MTQQDANTVEPRCGHRNVTGTFDETGRHLSNRCDDCGYTVDWTLPELNRVMDLGVTARLLAARPDVRIHAVQDRGHGWEVFCYTCSDLIGLLDTEEEALRERGAHLDEAHSRS